MASEICKTCARKRNCTNGIWCSVCRQYVERYAFENCRFYEKETIEKSKSYPERQKTYYQVHREEMLQRSKEWHRLHPEKQREYNRKASKERQECMKEIKMREKAQNIDLDKVKALFKDPTKAAHLQWLVERRRNAL